MVKVENDKGKDIYELKIFITKNSLFGFLHKQRNNIFWFGISREVIRILGLNHRRLEEKIFQVVS